jgi:hypothetical protein
MEEPLTHQIGFDGFHWFVGVVENRSNDPLNIGRVQARIFGIHGDKTQLATAELPWAIPMTPITHPDMMNALKEGMWVCGFFLDGKLAQQPVIMGTFPGIPQ